VTMPDHRLTRPLSLMFTHPGDSVRRNKGAGALLLLGIALGMSVLVRPAVAEPVADFYRGKTVTVSVGFSAGGGYDLHARTLARFMPKYLPGSPTMIVRNAPGGSGLTLINALSNTAPRDGTEFGTIDRAIPLQPLIEGTKARFDPLKLNWIGSSDNDGSTCFAWHEAAVKTMTDLTKHELIVGATGSVGIAYAFPRLANAILGTKFRIINGYAGSTDVMLAIERGESQGFCSSGFATMELLRPDWVRERKINYIVQLAMEKHKDHPDVPLALDMAKTEADRQAIELVISPTLFARPFVAPPDVPKDRVAALRSAFNQTLADPDYLAEAKKSRMQVELVTGETMDILLHRLYSAPREVVDRVTEAMK
jgi:tripartite-type tricarboxylate transporter receptor subunit TctC